MVRMRKCKQHKKALRSVDVRNARLRIQKKKQQKFLNSGKESERERMERVGKLLNKIRKEMKETKEIKH